MAAVRTKPGHRSRRTALADFDSRCTGDSGFVIPLSLDPLPCHPRGLAGIDKAELRDGFPEFAELQKGCRFPDCTHDHEPDCVVYVAVERGLLAPTRYSSYLEILDELVPLPDATCRNLRRIGSP